MGKYLGNCEEQNVDMKIRTRDLLPYNVYQLSTRRRNLNFPVTSLASNRSKTTTFDAVNEVITTNCSSSSNNTFNEVVVCNSADFTASTSSSCCLSDVSSSSSCSSLSSSTEFVKNCDPQVENCCGETSSKFTDCKKEASEIIDSSHKYDVQDSSDRVDYPAIKPTVQIKPVAMMPSEAELEDFFSSAEKDLQKRFANKYNFDIVKDVPLDGRYEWVEIKP